LIRGTADSFPQGMRAVGGKKKIAGGRRKVPAQHFEISAAVGEAK